MSNRKYIVKVKTDGTVEREEFRAGDSLKQMQEAVGGLIERLPVPTDPFDSGYDIFINEEGLMLELTQNVAVTKLWIAYGGPTPIYGDAVVVGHDGEGGTVGLSENEAQAFETYFSCLHAL